MPSGPTYYDFFGVSPTASSDQIRRAYLALMKQCHPDRAGYVDERRTSDFAALVNRSYSVLRDPAKRARYDAYLTRRSPPRRKAPLPRRALLAGETQRRRSRTLDASSIGFLILACTVALTAIAAVAVPADSVEGLVGSVRLADTPLHPVREALSTADVRRQVRFAMAAMPDQALLASEDCFRSARDQSSFYQTQLCVLFDDAYVDWSQVADGNSSQSLYFNDALVRVRQRDAMAAVGSFQDSRLDQLRQIALNAMLLEIRSKVDVAPRSDSSAPSPASGLVGPSASPSPNPSSAPPAGPSYSASSNALPGPGFADDRAGRQLSR